MNNVGLRSWKIDWTKLKWSEKDDLLNGKYLN